MFKGTEFDPYFLCLPVCLFSLEQKVMQNVLTFHQMGSFLYLARLTSLLRYAWLEDFNYFWIKKGMLEYFNLLKLPLSAALFLICGHISRAGITLVLKKDLQYQADVS